MQQRMKKKRKKNKKNQLRIRRLRRTGRRRNGATSGWRKNELIHYRRIIEWQ